MGPPRELRPNGVILIPDAGEGRHCSLPGDSGIAAGEAGADVTASQKPNAFLNALKSGVTGYVLAPEQTDLDDALLTAISKSDTMIVIVADETQWSWWVPWEIAVSTTFRKPKAMYKPQTSKSLPTYLKKLTRLRTSSDANLWVFAHRKLR